MANNVKPSKMNEERKEKKMFCVKELDNKIISCSKVKQNRRKRRKKNYARRLL